MLALYILGLIETTFLGGPCQFWSCAMNLLIYSSFHAQALIAQSKQIVCSAKKMGLYLPLIRVLQVK